MKHYHVLTLRWPVQMEPSVIKSQNGVKWLQRVLKYHTPVANISILCTFYDQFSPLSQGKNTYPVGLKALNNLAQHFLKLLN